MSDDLVLVEGGVADIADIMRVMEEAFDAAYGEAWTAGQCLGILGLPGVWLTLARRGGEIAGFSLSRLILDEAELLLLGVRPAHARIGVGTALLQRASALAKGLGARRLHLEVREGNSALLLYSRAGFTQTGMRRAYYRGNDGQVIDALSLAVWLADAGGAQ